MSIMTVSKLLTAIVHVHSLLSYTVTFCDVTLADFGVLVDAFVRVYTVSRKISCYDHFALLSFKHRILHFEVNRFLEDLLQIQLLLMMFKKK